MAQRGLCSRREAEDWIKKGFVSVNGQVVDLKQSLFANDVKININQSAKVQQNKLITVALNKPVGYVSSQPLPGEIPAIKLLTAKNYWEFPKENVEIIPKKLSKLVVVGRLDKDSRGLLLFTQDGRIAKQIIGDDSKIEKEYIITVNEVITPRHIELLKSPMKLEGNVQI